MFEYVRDQLKNNMSNKMQLYQSTETVTLKHFLQIYGNTANANGNIYEMYKAALSDKPWTAEQIEMIRAIRKLLEAKRWCHQDPINGDIPFTDPIFETRQIWKDLMIQGAPQAQIVREYECEKITNPFQSAAMAENGQILLPYVNYILGTVLNLRSGR